MAKYWTDFSEYTTGVAPSDWSEHGSGGAGTVIASSLPAGYTGTKVLESTTLRMKWDTVGVVSGDTHMIARFRRTSTPNTNATRLTIFGDETGGTNYYFASPASTNLQIAKFVAGSSSTVGTPASFSWAANTWYYIELKITGTTLRARVWNEGDSVPDWMITGTDTSLTTGWVGIFDTLSGTAYTDWVGVGTNGDAAPTSLADLNTAPTFSVQPSVDYGAGIALTPTNTPVTINFTPADVDGDTITWDLVGNYPASPTVLDSGSTSAGVADSASLAYANAFFDSTDGDYALRVIISDGIAADVVSDEFFVSRASPPDTPPGTYVIRFNPSDTLSTDADELSWEIRTGAAGTGNLLAFGAATAGVLVQTDPIEDEYLTNGTNTRYLRVYDGAGNYDDESFIVEANLIQEFEYDFRVEIASTIFLDKLSARTRTVKATTGAGISMLRALTLSLLVMVAAALTISKNFVRQTLSTVSGNIISHSLVSRYRAWLTTTAATVAMSTLADRFRTFLVTAQATAQAQQERSIFRTYLTTTSATLHSVLRQGIAVLFKVQVSGSIGFSKLSTLTKTLVVKTRDKLTWLLDISAYELLILTVTTRANVKMLRFFNISALYKVTTKAAVRVGFGIAWLFKVAVPTQVRALRGFFQNFTAQVRWSVSASRLVSRFKAYLVTVSVTARAIRQSARTKAFLTQASAAIQLVKGFEKRGRAQTAAAIAMLRDVTLYQRVTTGAITAASKLLSLTHRYRVRTKRILHVAVGSVFEMILRVRTHHVIHMTRGFFKELLVTTTVVAAFQHFLRQVRDFWSTYITQELEWTTTTLNQTESEFTFITLPDEWGTTLYADGVLTLQQP